MLCPDTLTLISDLLVHQNVFTMLLVNHELRNIMYTLLRDRVSIAMVRSGTPGHELIVRCASLLPKVTLLPCPSHSPSANRFFTSYTGAQIQMNPSFVLGQWTFLSRKSHFLPLNRNRVRSLMVGYDSKRVVWDVFATRDEYTRPPDALVFVYARPNKSRCS